MATKLEEWSVLQGKTLLHIEAPNGVTILSMAKKRRAEAELVAALPTILNALFAWRSAEVHAAALKLGLRTGDEEQAKEDVEFRARELRILTDRLHQNPMVTPF